MGVISIASNAQLTSIAGLRRIPSVEGSLYITANPSLIDLTGLNNVSTCYNLLIQGNTALQSLRGLESLRIVTQDVDGQYPIIIDGNGNAANPSMTMDGLTGPLTISLATDGIKLINNGGWVTWGNAFINQTSLFMLTVTGNHHLRDLSGIHGTMEITGTLTIQSNRELTSLAGLASPFINRLTVDDCKNMTTLQGATTPRVNYMYITNNGLVTMGTNVSNFVTITTLSIVGNAFLRNLTDLNALTTITTLLVIDSNPLLTSISGFTALISVGEIRITSNAALLV